MTADPDLQPRAAAPPRRDAAQRARDDARLAARAAARPRPTYPDELPITARRDELLTTIAENQVVVVAGETGSGKSTQLPKLCLELGRGVEGLIGHTQPRRVAARTIAERVAEELGSEVGGAVGYAVRFTDRVGEGTYVKVMTDGILLAEVQRDRLLRAYDTLIVDEAHERSLNVDFLLGYLHQLLPRRPDLKLIITSATIDTARFSAHFGDAPVVEVSGRTHPVDVRYRPYGGLVAAEEGDDVIDDDRDQVEAVCDAVAELQRDTSGDVLVFLSGEREIRDTAEALTDRLPQGTEVLPLYARLSAAEQHRVFEPHRGRRVVLATNVAETSVTVPGVRSVVDAGTARISRYSHRLKVQRLPIEEVSQASADQRAGRCGRLGPGVCIRLYSEEDFAARDRFTDPEILRTNLASVILQMTSLGLGDVDAFPFLDPPDPRAVRDGVALLEELGALEPDRPADQRRLTEVGRRLVRLPVDPRLGRMVLEAERHGCVREVLVIAAALSIQDPRERPADQRQAADALHARFAVPGSDVLSLVRLWDHLEERSEGRSSNRFRRECRDEHINFLRVREWRDLRRQLERAARSIGVRAGEEEPTPEHVHRAVLAGLLSHVGVRDGETREYKGARGARFRISPGSALAKDPPAWVMATELVETDRLWARGAATVRPEWVEGLAGHLVKRSHGDPRWDERSGRAVTTERVTLYGIPIATRTVGYDRVDVDEARDLFLDHALVRREWRSPHAFLDANEATVVEAGGVGDRLRRDDLFDRDDALFRFYDERVGEDVVSGRHFDRWWKSARRDRPDLLTLTVGDLLDDPDVDLRAWPDVWRAGGIDLPITYRFDPADELDGVTVHIPLAVLDRVGPWGFDWQVPGDRRDLVDALVRTLPKSVRRELPPLGEVVAGAVAALRLEARPMDEALAAAIREVTGVPIDPADLDVRRVPPHLRITFAVDHAGTTLAMGKDLEAVRALVGRRVRRAVVAAFPGVERTGMTRWDVGEVRRELRTEVDGVEVLGYPALIDEGETVALRILTRAEEAERAMAGGVRRLVQLQVPVGVRGLSREVGSDVELALVAVPGLTLGSLLRDVLDAAASAVVAGSPLPWTETGFDSLVVRARSDLGPTAARALAGAGRVVVEAAAVRSRLDRLPAPSLGPSVDDAAAHLDRLVRPGFVTRAGVGRLSDLVRYLRGIAARLDKLAEDPERDRRRIAEVTVAEAHYAALVAALDPVDVTARVVEAGWGLEELRVATFAQSVGAKGKVSTTRALAEIDRLAAGDRD